MQTWKTVFLIIVSISFIQSVKLEPNFYYDGSEQFSGSKQTVNGKIKGLRVTVDTSEIKDHHRNSENEFWSSSRPSENKKTVGVRTDVRFEITNESNDGRKPAKGYSYGISGSGSKNGMINNTNFDPFLSVLPLDQPSPPREIDMSIRYPSWTTERNIDSHGPISFHRGEPYDYQPKPTQKPMKAMKSPQPVDYHQQLLHHHKEHKVYLPCSCKEYPGPYISYSHESFHPEYYTD